MQRARLRIDVQHSDVGLTNRPGQFEVSLLVSPSGNTQNSR
jgi:hypothetical protein